ncbi:MAG: hypothetical protein SA378_06390 [Sedimentibacter sp.]|uniref:hypothetical protein n=1 Tax=Sedimentibacter sp. TaxID=1960295 RepID=UPI002981E8FE|nr:hypothetical protein [Sedimentibacter sp.]MDW5299745.1 hypothetical protein [Sedimentibacter sp.]
MSIEIIKVIKDAEEKAEVIKKEAVQQSKQIITNANAEVTKIVDEAKEDAYAKRAEVLKEAEAQSQLFYDSIVSDAAKECEDILKNADKHMDDAASIILERIVKASGNS